MAQLGDTIVKGDLMVINEIYKQVDDSIKRVPTVYHGTTEPDNSLGEDGDIYILLDS